MSSIVTSSNPRSLKSRIALVRICPRSLFFFSARKPISRHPLLGRRSTARLFEPSHDESRVVSAEGERVAHGGPDLLTAACIRHVVQVALRVGHVVLQRRGN